jgi:hypothetical protein
MPTFLHRFRAVDVAALALAILIGSFSAKPALSATAGQISTRNIIIGAVAVTAAVILYNEYHHTAGTIVGRTSDGGRVYIDGRVIFPDGAVVYLSNDGRRPCSYWGDEDRCGIHARGFIWRFEGERDWHGEGLHRGWDQGHGNPHHDQGENDDGGRASS